MAELKPLDYRSHIERTAAEPRHDGIHEVVIKHIEPAGRNTRIVHLATLPDAPPIKFFPGQWLDVFTPASPRPGGFTITSPPYLALPQPDSASGSYPHVELAIQASPTNPPAAYFHRQIPDLLGKSVHIRAGGSFVWPHAPPSLPLKVVKRYVFIAGGVGINPLMAIVSHLAWLFGNGQGRDVLMSLEEVQFLYASKASSREAGQESSPDASSILFLQRLVEIFNKSDGLLGGLKANGLSSLNAQLKLFLTSMRIENGTVDANGSSLPFRGKRISVEDLEQALGPISERRNTVVYVCGVPSMTDKFVEVCKTAEGMSSKNVLSEKWW